MNKEIEISELKITIGKREISLSVADAKKLHAALSELFGGVIKHEHHYDQWHWPYHSPIITYTSGTLSTAKTPDDQSVTITNAAYFDSARAMNPEGQ